MMARPAPDSKRPHVCAAGASPWVRSPGAVVLQMGGDVLAGVAAAYRARRSQGATGAQGNRTVHSFWGFFAQSEIRRGLVEGLSAKITHLHSSHQIRIL